LNNIDENNKTVELNNTNLNNFPLFNSLNHKKISLLNLNNNDIKIIPDYINEYTDLVVLYLCNNKISNISNEIKKLTKLTWLDLSNNQLTYLPKEIKYLTSLTRLHLKGNDISLDNRNEIKMLLPNCYVYF